MDETNTQRGNTGKERVVKIRGNKTAHKQGGANKETVTAIVTICAHSSTLDPTLIFKGENLFACSPKGWTDSKICKDWIKDVFEPATREKANGELRVLFMDGHSSHFTPEIIDFSLQFHIMIVGYPPHCTHALQGLDVVCFAKMKTEMKNAINEFEETHQHPVAKADFTGVFGQAFLKSFDEETVKAAFRVTGVHPFDRAAIRPEQMKPAEATSVKGSFAQL
ncbi:hypothetical protein K435DRAFT_819286 [Dendrothele bispora CBS 962.96]|uniref:DDE-1 domain-containing protein n=1 Tax=Dendrothele bispora (strain CBS 962.96) TaxID=1314807 RepID=A0A4S8M4P9_DENBC|nr:hypothetical protein K435DRAFT_819286 [Dendrothele bispora CBS 962.96]